MERDTLAVTKPALRLPANVESKRSLRFLVAAWKVGDLVRCRGRGRIGPWGWHSKGDAVVVVIHVVAVEMATSHLRSFVILYQTNDVNLGCHASNMLTAKIERQGV